MVARSIDKLKLQLISLLHERPSLVSYRHICASLIVPLRKETRDHDHDNIVNQIPCSQYAPMIQVRVASIAFTNLGGGPATTTVLARLLQRNPVVTRLLG